MKINLDECKIKVKGKWLSSGELTQLIQEKMKAGDMQFSDLAASLEELNKALENSHALDVKVVISKEQYNKFKKLGQSDDRECIRKAITQFVGSEDSHIISQGKSGLDRKKQDKKKHLTVKCANCSAPIKVGEDRENNEIRCLRCGARGLLKHRQ